MWLNCQKAELSEMLPHCETVSMCTVNLCKIGYLDGAEVFTVIKKYKSCISYCESCISYWESFWFKAKLYSR